MINSPDVTKENINEHNSNWLQLPDHLLIIEVIRGFYLEKQMYYLI